MHGSPFHASPFNNAIIEKDYVGVRYIMIGVTNSGPEWCYPTSPVSLCQVILSAKCCGGKREHILHNIMFVNVIGMTQVCSFGQVLYTMTKHRFTFFEWGNVTFERYCKEIILGHVRFFRDAVTPDFLFMMDNVQKQNTQVTDIPEREVINYVK